MSFLTLMFMFLTSVHAQEPICIERSALEKTASHFKQFAPLLETSGEKICSTKKNRQWFQVLYSMEVLKTLPSFETKEIAEDGLTTQPVKTNSWWNYFLERSHKFKIVKCDATTVAYVYFEEPGRIYLCPPFFRAHVIDQVSILLHEVRHFDRSARGGRFDHVNCKTGYFKGTPSCDKSLEYGGSYAVTVQSHVAMGMAKGSPLSKAEKVYSKALGLSYLESRFNKPASMKIKNSLFLTDVSHRLFEWDLGANQIYPSLQLETPARIFMNSDLYLTMYPLDLTREAYRIYREDFSLNENKGAYAKKYNASDVATRSTWRDVSYADDGGAILTTTELFCLNVAGEMSSTTDPLVIQTKSLVGLERRTFLLTFDGELYSLTCPKKAGQAIKFKKDKRTLPRDVSRAFELNNVIYALNEAGILGTLTLERRQFHFQPLNHPFVAGQTWTQAIPARYPYFFLSPPSE